MDIPSSQTQPSGGPLGGIGGFLGGLADDVGRSVVDVVMTVVFGFVADAVAAVTTALAPTFNSESTRVDLAGGWFNSEGGAAVTALTSVIAGSLVLVFLFLALVRALLAGEFSAMWRASLIDVPVAFLGTAVTVIVASGLLETVDVASVSLLGADGEQLAAFSESLADAKRLNGAGLLGIMFGLLFIIGAVLVWIQLLVRAALIYIVIAFAPIMWVTRAYPGTRNISRRGIETAIALIVSKFVMAVSFRLGAEALRGGSVTTDEVDLSAMLVGAAIMLLTAFIPFAVFKVIPIVESATAGSGADKAAVGAAVVGAGAAVGGSVVAAKLAGSGIGMASGAVRGLSGRRNKGSDDGDGGGAGSSDGSGDGGSDGGGSSRVAGGSTGPSGGSGSSGNDGDDGEGSGSGQSTSSTDGSSSTSSSSARGNSRESGGTPASGDQNPIVVEQVGGSAGVGVMTVAGDESSATAPQKPDRPNTSTSPLGKSGEES